MQMNAGVWLVVACCVWTATAQPFDPPATTSVRERITGLLMSGPGAPAPEPGDQLLAFFNDTLLGVHTFTSDQADPRSFDLLVIGDNPNTQEVEGPKVSQPLSLRFFDASTNFVRTDVAALNTNGEVFNLTFQGRAVIEITDTNGVPLPIPIDLTPRRNLDALIGGDAAKVGGAGGKVVTGAKGKSGASGGSAAFDVDGDGKITRGDAIIVIRLVIGARRAVSDQAASRADVNGDGVVNTKDAIAILRSRQ